mgnify:FL=1
MRVSSDQSLLTCQNTIQFSQITVEWAERDRIRLSISIQFLNSISQFNFSILLNLEKLIVFSNALGSINLIFMSSLKLKLKPEVWLPIPSCPGYSASNQGRIRSDVNQFIRSLQVNPSGYIQVGLHRKTRTVHRLVLEAFQGPSPLQVDHLNGVKADNRLVNLRYVTNQVNQLNKRKQKAGNPYRGVGQQSRGSWRAVVWYNRQRFLVGSYPTAEEARDARTAYIQANNLPNRTD